jgi:hemoglobin
MSRLSDDMQIEVEISESMRGKTKLVDRVGGPAGIARVHKLFYDKLYSHAWIGQFFAKIERSSIEAQQTDFMTMLFGGSKSIYSGRMPIDAHEHIMITEELFNLRSSLLKESLVEAGLKEPEISDWLRIDGAFKKVLVKETVSQCRKRYTTDTILDFAPTTHKSKDSA